MNIVTAFIRKSHVKESPNLVISHLKKEKIIHCIDHCANNIMYLNEENITMFIEGPFIDHSTNKVKGFIHT